MYTYSVDEAILQNIDLETLKRLVIRAAHMTRKRGLVPPGILVQRFKFDGNNMKVYSGPDGVPSVGGSIKLTQSDGGWRIHLGWEKDAKECRESTTFFLENLKKVAAPGGFRLGPRSPTLIFATVLLFIMGLLSLCVLSIDYVLLREAETDSLGEAWLKIQMFTNGIVAVPALVGGILALQRQRQSTVKNISSTLAVIYASSIIGSIWLWYHKWLPVPILAIVLVLAVVTVICIWRSKDEFET